MRGEVAFIDENLCKECEACVDECPEGAILSVETVEAIEQRAEFEKAGAAVTDMVQVGKREVAPSTREPVLLAVGSALLWAGREILPRLASMMLDRLERSPQQGNRLPQPRANGREGAQKGGSRGGGRGRGGGGRRRQRRRSKK